MDWDGPACCWDGAECLERNEWYSQCVPEIPSAVSDKLGARDSTASTGKKTSP